MVSAENSISSTVFWVRLPLSLLTSGICFILLEFTASGRLIPGIANTTTFLVITVGYFLLVQVAVHWLMLGLNSQVYGRAPKRVDIAQDRVSCWIPPPRRTLSEPEGTSALVEVPFDNILQVNAIGNPGAVIPFARVRATGLNLPKEFFIGPEREIFNITLTRSNAVALRKAWAEWSLTASPLRSGSMS
jgi:hypothetical protein